MVIKKAEMALLTAFILFLAPMAVYPGNGVLQDTLRKNEKLRASEELKSTNGRYDLRMEGDGNLVAYDNQGKTLRSSNTMGSGATECVMQGDGNLLLKERNGRVVWATNTDRGQGRGVVAKRLGIKPRSKEFHALKKDDTGLLSKGKSQGRRKKDKDKS